MPIRRMIEALLETVQEAGNPVSWVEHPFSFQEMVDVNGVQYQILTTGYMQRIIYSTHVLHLRTATVAAKSNVFSELLVFNANYHQSLRFGYSSPDDSITLSGEVVADLENVGYVLKLCLDLRQALIDQLADLPPILHPYSEIN